MAIWCAAATGMDFGPGARRCILAGGIYGGDRDRGRWR
jgi:hypothetical protein